MNTSKILLSLLGICFASVLMAQPAPPATPIDGGLSVLLAGGALYGLKKIRDNRKQ